MFILVIFWIVISYAIGRYAESRGHSFAVAFLASVLLSPFLTFVIIALIAPGQSISGSRTITEGMIRECPFCAEPVKIQAVNCPHCCKNIPQVIVQRVPYSKPAPAFSVMGISLILTLVFGFIGFLVYANEKQDSDKKVIAQTAPQPITASSASKFPETSEDMPPANYGPDWVMVDNNRIDSITQVSPAPDNQVHIATSTTGQNILASKLPKGFLKEWHLSDVR